MSRILTLAYGLFGYVIFLGTFLYLIGFTSGLIVPVTLDRGGVEGPVGMAILIDVGLVALFAVQHTIMARSSFKRRISTVIPSSIERTTFMLATCAVFAVMFTQWRPIPTSIWEVEGTAAWVVHGIGFTGWGLVLISTFLIDHFDLFGLRQTWLAFRGRPYTSSPFVERSLYRFMRHPMMLGMLVAMWATPTMTIGHLVLAGSYTVYIFAALFIEERDLIAAHGNAYREYQRRVPKLLPFGSRRAPESASPVAAG